MFCDEHILFLKFFLNHKQTPSTWPHLPIGSARSFFIKAAAQTPPRLASSFSNWMTPWRVAKTKSDAFKNVCKMKFLKDDVDYQKKCDLHSSVMFETKRKHMLGANG